MKRSWVIYDDGTMVEKIRQRRVDSHYVIEDIKPYKSMIDGTIISSRSKHRQHLKQNNCIEVGNERMENTPQRAVDSRRQVLREQVANMTHREANRILAQVREQVRFSNPHRK